jgi:LCP family protein required for cell wall assembly
MSSRARRPGRRTWFQRALLGLGALVTVTCLLAAGTVWYAKHRLDDVTRIELGSVLTPEGQTVRPGTGQAGRAAPASTVPFPSRVENYLVVGSDSREGADPDDPDYANVVGKEEVGGKRSDTIMVLRYDPVANRAALLSFPRDLWVPINGGRSKNRINAAFNRGPAALVKTITSAFEIPIHHYVEVDFQGFKRMVDAIGGVSIWFDHPVRDRQTGLNITATGCVELDGIEALQYARSRHLQSKIDGRWRADGSGDLGRISRQQDFVRRALEQALDAAMGNPLELNELLGAAADNLTIDKRLDLLAFASRLQTLRATTIENYTIPAYGKMIDGMAVLMPRRTQSEPILEYFRGGAKATGATASTESSPRRSSPPSTAEPVGTVPGTDHDCG